MKDLPILLRPRDGSAIQCYQRNDEWVFFRNGGQITPPEGTVPAQWLFDALDEIKRLSLQNHNTRAAWIAAEQRNQP